MTRRISIPTLVSSCLLCGTFLAAGDFWDEKPYEEWTRQEVQTIITNSPWSRRVEAGGVTRGYDWGGLSRPETGGGPGAGPASGGNTRPTPTIQSPTGGPPKAGGTGDDVAEGRRSSRPGKRTYFVVWSSATTVRKALGRNLVLQGRATSEEVAQSLARTLNHYRLTVIGRDLSAFTQVNEEQLKENSYLRPKKLDKEFQPLSVQIGRAGTQEAVASVTFLFPMNLPSGEPLIHADEKKVEFRCRMKELSLDIQTSFDLKKMRIEGQADI